MAKEEENTSGKGTRCSIVFFASLAFFCYTIGLIWNNWLTGTAVMTPARFGHEKYYGLWSVQYAKSQSWGEHSLMACTYYDQTFRSLGSVASVCSPLCNYYRLACVAYSSIYWLNMGCLAIFGLCFLFLFSGVFNARKTTPKESTRGAIFLLLSTILAMIVFVCQSVVVRELVSPIGTVSQYPIPAPSGSCYCCLIGAFFNLFATLMGCCNCWKIKRDRSIEDRAWDDVMRSKEK